MKQCPFRKVESRSKLVSSEASGEAQPGQAVLPPLPEEARERLIDEMVKWVGGWVRSRAEEVLEEPWSYGENLEASRWQICGAVAEDLEHDYGEAIEELICEAYAAELRQNILLAYSWTQSQAPALPLRCGGWIPHYPSQVHSPGRLAEFFPGHDAGRSWCYDVELGAHQLVPTSVLAPFDPEVTRMLEHMEDVQFLADGWFDYPAKANEADWFNLGGFSKVQPYYTRNCEIYALRDDIKPFIRSYFNNLAAMLNPEVLTFWEHFRHSGAWDKTHETGYFLHQTRTMLVTERDRELWLAPLVTSNWFGSGMVLAVSNAPTRFGAVTYRIQSTLA